MSLQERLTERFLRYAAVPSQSKEGCAVVPSTPGQWDMAKLLKEDLAELGFSLTAYADSWFMWKLFKPYFKEEDKEHHYADTEPDQYAF